MAPEGMDMAHFSDPTYKNWGAKWGALMAWALSRQYLREKLKLGTGGETDAVNDMVRHIFERTGAHIMGKRMFEGGERGWPEEAPFHTPVYVLTHERRNPWVRRVEPHSTLSMTAQNRLWRWHGKRQESVTSAFPAMQILSSST